MSTTTTGSATRSALAPAAVSELYRDAIIVDGSIAPRMDDEHVDRMRASGVTAVNWTVPRPFSDLHRSLFEIAAALELIDRRRDALVLVRTVGDIERAKADGRVGVILGPQNAGPCEEGTHLFRILHALGIRVIQLTYNERNHYGDGATELANGGLNRAGRDAIGEMDRLGIVLDLSHCGDRTTLEAIEASANPVIISHANSRSVLASPRNKTDEALRLLASRGGVVGLTLWSPMVRFDQHPVLGDFLRHLQHVADLIGVDHIAIGTDHSEGVSRDRWESEFGRGGKYPSVTGGLGPWYGYDTRFVAGAASVRDLPRVIEAIASLGFTAAELHAILGGNFLRVFRAVWGA